MDRAPAKRSADVCRLPWRLPLGSERALVLATIGRCSRLRSITLRTITVRNPAVAGNILRVLVFCRLTLGAKLMAQEESHPDEEGHADNRRRRQSGQVAEQGALLSGRPTGLPARVTVTLSADLIGVTADEHWVIHRGSTYALLLIANGQPAAPSPLGTENSGRREAWPAGGLARGRLGGRLARAVHPGAGDTAPAQDAHPGGQAAGLAAGRAGRNKRPGRGTGRKERPGRQAGRSGGAAGRNEPPGRQAGRSGGAAGRNEPPGRQAGRSGGAAGRNEPPGRQAGRSGGADSPAGRQPGDAGPGRQAGTPAPE